MPLQFTVTHRSKTFHDHSHIYAFASYPHTPLSPPNPRTRHTLSHTIAVDGLKFLVLDMTPVVRSDSAGAHFVYDLAKDLKRKGIQLVLSNPTQAVSAGCCRCCCVAPACLAQKWGRTSCVHGARRLPSCYSPNCLAFWPCLSDIIVLPLLTDKHHHPCLSAPAIQCLP